MWTCGCNPEKNIMTIDDVPNDIMMNPCKLLPYLESRGAGNAGICLIKKVNHEHWFNEVYMDESAFYTKKFNPIEQIAIPVNGHYQQSSEFFCNARRYPLLPKKIWTVKNYIDYARQNNPSSKFSFYDLEDKFWANVGTTSLRIYAADLRFSMMNPTVEGLNFNKWPTYMSRFTAEPLVGIDKPYSYMGMWMTDFVWHTEENELFSMNICYDGCKGWYSIDRDQTNTFTEYVNTEYASVSDRCANFTRHKRVILSPRELQAAGIHVHKIVQEAGDIVVTFPGGLHAGINFQYNRNEAIAMACRGWSKFCRSAIYCDCPGRKRVPEALDDITPVIRQLEPKKLPAWLLKKEGGASNDTSERVTRQSTKLINARDNIPSESIEDDPKGKKRRCFLSHEDYNAYQQKQNCYRVMAKRQTTMRSSKLHRRRNDWNNPGYPEALRWILNHPEQPIGRVSTYKKLKRGVKDVLTAITPAALLKHMYSQIFPTLVKCKPWGLNVDEHSALKNLLSRKSKKLQQ